MLEKGKKYIYKGKVYTARYLAGDIKEAGRLVLEGEDGTVLELKNVKVKYIRKG